MVQNTKYVDQFQLQFKSEHHIWVWLVQSHFELVFVVIAVWLEKWGLIFKNTFLHKLNEHASNLFLWCTSLGMRMDFLLLG